MKKNICLALAVLLGITISHAQVAKWVMKPVYDSIYIPEGASFIVTANRTDNHITLWDKSDCQLLQYVEGKVYPFHDSVAVNTGKNDNIVNGLVWNTGVYVAFPKGTYSINPSYPYFSCGYLIVQEPSNYYRYISKTHKLSRYRYNCAFPFFHGFSSCEYFQDQVDMKNPIRCLMNKEMKFVQFYIHGKPVKKTDIDFISSINDEYTAVVVVKKKVYLFRLDSDELIPLCAKEGSTNLKEQAKIDDLSQNLIGIKNNTIWVLRATCPKTEVIKIFFDEFMRATIIRYTDKDKEFVTQKKMPQKLPTTLRKVAGDNGYGLFDGKKEVLAPQFEEITACFDNQAIVRKNGKYGLIQVLPNKKFNVTLFDKDAMIPFIHKELHTTIQVNIPQDVSSDSASVINLNPTLCEIDDNSWEAKKTRYANYIRYNCTLQLPKELFNHDTTEIVLPIQISYDGFLSPVFSVKKKAIIRRYWSVNVDNDSKRLDGDRLSFDFSLDYSDNQQRDAKYGVSVTAYPETDCRIESYSYTKYRCTVQNLKDGLNQIDIQIKEDGFPPSSFPIYFEYHPQVDPTEEVPEGKAAEVFSIEVKESKPVRKSNTPRVIGL